VFIKYFCWNYNKKAGKRKAKKRKAQNNADKQNNNKKFKKYILTVHRFTLCAVIVSFSLCTLRFN